MIFESLAKQEIGPPLIFQNQEYRIEGFMDARPLTIWEMRNPIFYSAFADAICKLHYNKELKARISDSILPCDKSNLFSDVIIDQWAPEIKELLPSFRGKLLQDNGIPHPELLRVIDAVDRHFLFPGYQEFFRGLMNRDTVVFAHCDAHEYNILAMRRDATKIMLIDYEYCGWQPRAFDLANYLNEVAFDNVYPYNKGIALYPQNLMGEAEVRDFLT